MTEEQRATLIICGGSALITLVVHLLIKTWWSASLVALVACVGGTAFWVWQRAESAFWIIALVIATKLAGE